MIMSDQNEGIVCETPTIYSEHRIERIYEFDDGAVVKYEWQDLSRTDFNHRFTLVVVPTPNPAKLVQKVIKTIDYHPWTGSK